MTQPSLSEKEQRVYDFISNYFEKHSRPPTYQEIREKLDYEAISTVQRFISQLITKGYIKAPIGSSRKRAIELVGKTKITDVEHIPLEGYVAAGVLTEAVAQREYIDLPRNFLKAGYDYFALRVKGDSMIDDCIMDGDYVVIKRQSNAQNGQTVVALVDNLEATIKKFFKRKTHIELVPANPKYKVIKVDPAKDFKILGVLASVVRRFD